MKTKLHIIIFLFLSGILSINAQIIPQKDTLPEPPSLPDSLLTISDSIKVASPTIDLNRGEKQPSFPTGFPTGAPFTGQDPQNYKVSESALDKAIEYTARDSQRMDAKNELVYLYGEAEVKYETMTLKADYIVFNMKDNIATAEGTRDSLGHWVGKPEFKEGDQVFGAKKLRYNFKTGKGIIYSAATKQNDMHVVGEKTKFFGKNKERGQDKDYVYSSRAIVSSCDHPEPHFGFRSKKLKVVPDEVAVTGPANLEIAGIGTPLWIPFGAFPLTKGKRGGLVRGEWEYSDAFGFGLQRWGWYFPVSEKMDVTLTADIYLRGSFRIYGNMRYNKRYKYTGSINLTFANLRNNIILETVTDRSISLRWSHTQNAKAHPTRKFGGNINIQTNDFQSRNLNNPNAVLENTLSSNVTYNQKFPGKPYTLSASFNHSQNTRSKQVTIQFPTVNFQMNQIYPFKRKTPSGPEQKWYEKISFRYTGQIRNTFTATDTTLFTQETLENARYGVKHEMSSSTSIQLLKYFTVSPNVNFKEIWYFNHLDKQFDPTLQIDTINTIYTDPGDSTKVFFETDTTSYGSVDENLKFGFKPLHLFNTSINLSTNIFGTLLFKKGFLRGFRHKITPTIGFAYTPTYATDFYFGTVQTDTRQTPDEYERYAFSERGIFDRFTNFNSAKRSMRLTYGFTNLFEGKYYSKRDSTEKKFKIFQGINVNGSYDFAADSLNWSNVTIRGNHSFFKGITNFTFFIDLSPYIFDDNNRQINKFAIKEKGKLLLLNRATFNFTTSLTARKIKDLFGKKDDSRNSNNNSGGSRNGDHTGFSTGSGVAPPRGIDPYGEEAFSSWFDSFSLNHQFNTQISKTTEGVDSFRIVTNSISIRGAIPLTKKWNMTISNLSYDFQSKRLVYPALGFSRDLHCWVLDFQWYPANGVYTFSLRVKNSTLGFLKVPWQRNQNDAARIQSGLGGF